MSLSLNKLKYINALRRKKERLLQKRFIVEGEKIVGELLNSTIEIETIIATPKWMALNNISNTEVIIVSPDEMKKASQLTTPQTVMAIAKIPEVILNLPQIEQELSIVLDNLQDPGNMGTIIRTADWFGINRIICSLTCVDCYNPKVVQASMGSVLRTTIHYVDLTSFFNTISISNNFPIYAMLLEGHSIYSKTLKNKGLILFGNESKGISDNLLPYITERLYIPEFPAGERSAESLNVATATAIVCAEFRRRLLIA